MPDIFLSYRRDDSAGHTGRLADALRRRFGDAHVFQDVEGIAPGEDFVDAVQRAIARCNVLLVVIGREWLDARDTNGQRRLDDPADHVRQEIAAALARDDVRVIPLLVENATMPRAADLPADITPLARRNALPLSDIGWDDDVARLIAAIERTPERVATTTQASHAAPRARGSLPPRLGLAAAVVALIVIAVFALRGGEGAGDANAEASAATELPGDAPIGSRPLRMAGPYEASLGMATVALRTLRIDSVQDGRRLVATFRLDNHAEIPLEFRLSEFELDQGVGFEDAIGAADVTVQPGTSADADMTFPLALDLEAAVLRFRHAAEVITMPLDLRADVVATPAPPSPASLEIARTGAEPLSIGPFEATLERTTVRRFVNRDVVTVALRLRNASAEVQRFSSLQLHLVADESAEPTFIDFERIIPPGGTAVDSAVFRITSGAAVTALRFIHDDAFTELPLGSPASR